MSMIHIIFWYIPSPKLAVVFRVFGGENLWQGSFYESENGPACLRCAGLLLISPKCIALLLAKVWTVVGGVGE